MGTVANLINDKNVRIKTASIMLIFLVASVSLWSIYGAPVWGANVKNNNTNTSYHKVTVNIVGQEISSLIEPLQLVITEPSCECQSCGKTQDQTNSLSANGIINHTIQEKSESRIVALVAYKNNGSVFMVTEAINLLWNHTEWSENVNRTAAFISIEITPKDSEDKPVQFYVLLYFVQSAEYILSMHNLIYHYNYSITSLDYVPTGMKADASPLSMELVKFDSSVTLSQNYRSLGKVAGELSTIYSMNKTLSYLAERYRTIKAEVEYLSELVSQQLYEYNRMTLRNAALITDGCIYDSDCSYIGQGYVCLGSSCGPCFSCSQTSQCTSQFGSGWTCSHGCCRQPGYQYVPPPVGNCQMSCGYLCGIWWGLLGCGAACGLLAIIFPPIAPYCAYICGGSSLFGCALICYSACGG